MAYPLHLSSDPYHAGLHLPPPAAPPPPRPATRAEHDEAVRRHAHHGWATVHAALYGPDIVAPPVAMAATVAPPPPACRLCLPSGTQVHAPHPSFTDGRTPLMVAAAYGHPACVADLLARGADANAADADGDTALHYAVHAWRITDPHAPDAATQALLASKRVDVNRRNRRGQTPLWVAARWGHVGPARRLLLAEADAALADDAGETPMDVAMRRRQAGVAATLCRGALGALEDLQQAKSPRAALPQG